MIDLSETAGIYLYPGFTDMRCGIRSLTIKVAASFSPEKYIAYVLSQLGKTKQSDIDSLLPWSESLPKEVRSSKYEVPKGIVDSIKKDRYE